MKNTKQKSLKVTVKTKQGKSVYLCGESEISGDYGNKKYIGIYKLKSQSGTPFQVLDCRYEINYNFVEQVLEFFVLHFGQNLKTVKVEWC